MKDRLLTLFIALLMLSDSQADDSFEIPETVNTAMTKRCIDCHQEGASEGDVRLDSLKSLDKNARLDLLNRMQEQVVLKRMPPEDEEQLSSAERELIANWLSKELGKHGGSKLEQKLKKPEYGNYLDHEKLFSGEFKHLPGFTYDRRWLISEYIFNAKFQRILLNNPRHRRQGKNVPVVGSHRFRSFSLTNPFLLPNRSGVRYYADTDLTGGHLSSMLTNAQKTSEYITNYLVKRHSKYLPAINQLMAMEDRHQATLTSRRKFLEDFIDVLCEKYYDDENRSLLPTFVPVKLKEVKSLKEGETYKKAPFHVARNMLKNLNGENAVFQALLNPEHASSSDEEIRELCERAWFNYGDHQRDIQGRVTILRDYLPEIREHLEKNRKKIKRLLFKPLGDDEMKAIQSSILQHRKPGDHYRQIIDKCMLEWERGFAKERAEAGPPSDSLLNELVEQLSLLILERTPTSEEAKDYLSLTKNYIVKLGKLRAIQKLIQTFILSGEFVYRQEFGFSEPDEHGRRMLSPRDASYAIA